MRALVIGLAALAIGCGPGTPVAQEQPGPAVDETARPWYSQAADELAAFNRQAGQLVDAGKFDQAAALIGETQPLADRLLSVPRPSLAGMQAAADHDDLYGRVLLHSGRVGWARMTFQKNLVRWRNWKPQTPETEARTKAAAASVAECDRRM